MAKPPMTDFAVFALAALTHALNPNTVTPREAFVSARAFLAEAEKQIPGIADAMLKA